MRRRKTRPETEQFTGRKNSTAAFWRVRALFIYPREVGGGAICASKKGGGRPSLVGLYN